MEFPAALRQGIEAILSGYQPSAVDAGAARLYDRYHSVPGEAAAQSDADEPVRRPAAAPRAFAEPLDPAQVAAYLATRTPATFAAVAAAIEVGLLSLDVAETDEPPPFLRSVLDLGAGPGTATWAAACALGSVERATLIERDGAMTTAGRRLAAAERAPDALRTARWLDLDWQRAAAGVGAGVTPAVPAHGRAPLQPPATSLAADLVIASYVLGELSPGAIAPALGWALDQTRHVLLLLEPGTPRGFQTILDARKVLLARGARLLSPCPHAGACGLSGASSKWCHFSRRLARSTAHRRLKTADLGWEDEKYCYLAFAKADSPWARLLPPPARIVGHPRTAPRQVHLELCEGSGALSRRTIDRAHGPVFRDARDARWGDPWYGAAE